MARGDKKEDTSLLSFSETEDIVMHIFKQNPIFIYTFKQLHTHEKLHGMVSKELLDKVLDKLVSKDRLRIEVNFSYALNVPVGEIWTGIVDHVNPKFAFVVTGDAEQGDIWVKTEDLHGAIDGDKVSVRIYKPKRGNKSTDHAEAEVIEVLERKRNEFAGKIQISPRFGFVVPDGRKIHFDIFVHNDNLNGAKDGDKVVVKIIEWPQGTKNPVGIVTKVLGQAGENNTEMHAILIEFGLPSDFPEEVERAANEISTVINEEEIAKRRDFRDILTFTIDPIDAKDFDDALSFKYLPNGNYEIGVHIADVTHYITHGTVLEEEAYYRATSVYLVDRCVPMLPEKLSNDLCSLRPNEDKLTFSAVFEIDPNGNVKSEWFGRTIIHSDKRFSYEDVQEIIENQEGEYLQEINILNQLAYKLRGVRFTKGAIGFETVEVKFKLDERGKPLAVIPKIRKDAHKLIEDFMLLANRQVATFVFNKLNDGEHGPTMVYRVHDSPNIEKLESFSIFATKFGHKLDLHKGGIALNLNKFIHEIEGKPEENVLQNLAVRTMAKARYTTDEHGHFGLAFEHYSHFTSPIRRYPDMMAHRLLQHYLDGNTSAPKEEFEEKCKYSSDREKLAAEAERASIKYKQVEYMQLMEKRPFEGIVSGVTEWGIYVEMIENKCEGLIRMADMNDDFYELDAKNYRVVGRRTGREISLGDKLTVIVKSTDLEKRTIDLTLDEESVTKTSSRPISRGNAGESSKNRRSKPAKGSYGKKKKR